MPKIHDETASWTVGSLLQWATHDFQSKQLSDARLSAEILLAHALTTNRVGLYLEFDRPLSDPEKTRFRDLVRKRRDGFPVAYLTNMKEFYSLPLYVDSSVLVPRPETEILVDETLREIRDRAYSTPKVLEVGVGSGAVAIALKKQLPSLDMTAVDISREALAVAKRNALKHDVEIRLIQGDLAHAVRGSFDLVVANLPYVPAETWDQLPIDVREYEPRLALDGGKNGLVIVERLIKEVVRVLQKGSVILEIGVDQNESGSRYLETHGFHVSRCRRDLAGIPRIVVADRVTQWH